MSRISQTFSRLRKRGERALIPYFTAGDPGLEVTRQLVEEAAARGADLIELGLPFSDPLADGPTIQRASQRALAQGASLAKLLPVVASLRGRVSAPLILMSYLNPLHRHGLAAAVQELVQAGFDGLIVPDLPPEEGRPLDRLARAAGLDLIPLVAPTSGPERLRLIARRARGFLYLVALTGVTGARAELPPDLLRQIRELRAVTSKPICVGFGLSTPEHVREVVRWADGAIVGSAIVRRIEELQGDPGMVGKIGGLIAALKGATRESGPGGSPSE